MKKQSNWLVLLILILAMAGLACNAILGDDEAEPETESAVTVEVATVAAGETAGETTSSAAPTLNLNPENNFGIPTSVNTFRFNVDILFEETAEDGTVESGRIIATGAQVVNPFASTMNMTFEGGGEELGLAGTSLTFTQVEGESFIETAGLGCITTGENPAFDTPMTDFANTADFLGGLQGATLVEENVSVNGVQTNHYRFDDSALAQSGEQSFGTLQNVEGHVYVSREEGYLIRMTVEADGTDISFDGVSEGTTSGHVVYQIDYSDYNAPIVVEKPASCDGGGDSEFPMLGDATNVTTFGDIVNYATQASFEDIVEFYETEMVAAGYTLTSDFSSPPTAVLTFEKEGQEVTVTVSEDTAGGGFLVTILKG